MSKLGAVKNFFASRLVDGLNDAARAKLIQEISSEVKAELYKSNMFGDPKIANELGRRKISLYVTCLKLTGGNLEAANFLYKEVTSDKDWLKPDA